MKKTVAIDYENLGNSYTIKLPSATDVEVVVDGSKVGTFSGLKKLEVFNANPTGKDLTLLFHQIILVEVSVGGKVKKIPVNSESRISTADLGFEVLLDTIVYEDGKMNITTSTDEDAEALM